ncbi:HU family DNA-binding protein [Oceanispirochaeta crateris]|uniref:HU family DNA-binding protein n=1 Tax=Oceanispirochaeta crateris TaxID=2518645 RepID=A0A5C1QT03_9SPIO|nr:HU family DNA-binding protein [Oceanispirochaeta crateris]QEN09754.1 HU family DNA-binding protein [Oceanispirochaeta crateris]
MSKYLTPGKLADRLQDKIDLDKEGTLLFGSELFSIIIRELKKDETFSLFGFGSFKKIQVKESKGRNPKTGEEIIIPAHYRIKFTPAGKLADRINAEYAHLKPIILEDNAHEGLLLKAERYKLETPADAEAALSTQESIIPPTVPITRPNPIEEPPAKSEANELDSSLLEDEGQIDEMNQGEPDFGFKKDSSPRIRKALLIGLFLLICFIGVGWFLLKGPDKVVDIDISDSQVPEPIEQALADAAIEPESPSDPIEEIQAVAPVLPGTSYNILPGDSFSLLAQKSWGNIHLWPYLYKQNRTIFPDPDLVRPGDSIIIPPQPDEVKDQELIEDSILMAYRRYRELMEEQSENPRNIRRQRSAEYVLLGGERLYPTFLERNKSSISLEEIRRVEDLHF